jgi:hypothetical protein
MFGILALSSSFSHPGVFSSLTFVLTDPEHGCLLTPALRKKNSVTVEQVGSIVEWRTPFFIG